MPNFMNEQDILNIYKIAIEKKLKKYSECNCCEKHKKDRPTRWDPMIELPFKGTQDRVCSCPCRHNARLLCCYHPDCKIERAKDPNLGHYVDDILDDVILSFERQIIDCVGFPLSVEDEPQSKL